MASATLMDVAKRLDAGGKIDKITEILAKTNPILEDLPFIEGNLPTGHKTTVRSGLPAGTWRKLNYGVQPEKSTTVQITDTCGMLETYSEVDKALADLNGNTSEFRLSEDTAFIEGMNQTAGSAFFYGDSSITPEKIMGLAPRYNSRSAENGGNIIAGGGSGSTNTSIWLVVMGDQTVHGIYPKGSKAGLNHEDKGQQTLVDANGGKYEGYRSHYKWDMGLVVRDWRYVVRIANIDVAALTKNAASGADLIDLIVQAIEKIPNINMGKAVLYANGTITSFLRRQMANKSNVHLNLEDVGGKKVLTFDSIPVKKADAILSTEATVS